MIFTDIVNRKSQLVVTCQNICFAGVIRAEEGSHVELDEHTVSLIVHEPIGVVAHRLFHGIPPY